MFSLSSHHQRDRFFLCPWCWSYTKRITHIRTGIFPHLYAILFLTEILLTLKFIAKKQSIHASVCWSCFLLQYIFIKLILLSNRFSRREFSFTFYSFLFSPNIYYICSCFCIISFSSGIWEDSSIAMMKWHQVCSLMNNLTICIVLLIHIWMSIPSLKKYFFGRIAKQFRLMDWWCPSVRLSVRPSVRPSVHQHLVNLCVKVYSRSH